jgi:hypothetical protein
MASTTVFSGATGFALYGTATNITGATGTTTITVTASGHGLAVKDAVKISAVEGMTDLNGTHIVTASSTTFAVVLGSATSQTYTTGGSVQRCIAIIGWTINKKGDTREVTDSNSGAFSEFINEGHTSFDGTFEGFLGDGSLRPTIGSSTTLVLYLNGTDYFSGTVKITGETDALSVKGTDAVKVSYTFQGTGTLTESNS